MTKRLLLLSFAALLVIVSCNHYFNCSKRGTSSIFVANFNSDIVGSMPAPTTPLHYGPPGASLEIQDGSGTVEVVNSAALGSNAMSITRGYPAPVINAVVGDNGTAPHNSGKYYIEFMAYGETIPEHLIAGISISARSSTNKAAFSFKLYGSSYYLSDGSSYVPLSGTYNPAASHFVHIELDLDNRNYSICIDDKVLIKKKAFLTSDFMDLYSLQFFVTPTITEAFKMVYVVDDIRITK
ncbi:MAG: hypothetical protein V3W18_08645 [candidate division Zixibacteria bacterium]